MLIHVENVATSLIWHDLLSDSQKLINPRGAQVAHLGVASVGDQYITDGRIKADFLAKHFSFQQGWQMITEA